MTVVLQSRQQLTPIPPTIDAVCRAGERQYGRSIRRQPLPIGCGLMASQPRPNFGLDDGNYIPCFIKALQVWDGPVRTAGSRLCAAD